MSCLTKMVTNRGMGMGMGIGNAVGGCSEGCGTLQPTTTRH